MLALGSDHGGYTLKEEIKKHLDSIGVEYKDYGCYDSNSCDYPVQAAKVCEAIQKGEAELGILFCGTGLGISMAANKHTGIRAACCSDYFSAKFCRVHNNANVLCLGGRVLGPGLASELVDIFINTEFEGGRHQRRIDMISEIEKAQKSL